MNILFLSLSKVWNIYERDIYNDLLRQFIQNGDQVYVVTPVERRYSQKTELINQGDAQILKVRTLNIQKTNIIEKGLGTVILEWQFLKAIKEYFKDVKFDLVLYATPPITLVKPIDYIKKRDGARTYLLLKDIFPQNAVDIGMMQTSGLKGLLYKVFRSKEKKLYLLSDRIGCMSQANVDYIIDHNSEVDSACVEVCPNSIEVQDMRISQEESVAIRKKYGIPQGKKVFVYGGNLGRPQGISFIIDCLRTVKNKDAFFLIVGDGTEYGKLQAFVDSERPANVKLMKRLPKDDYDRMIAACDVGLIFLDYRFTIPNFPSRLLAYMQAGLPVLACTDPNTDIGRVITEGGFGWWCESNSVMDFNNKVDNAINCELSSMSQNAMDYLKQHYTVDISYHTIMNSLRN